MEQPIERTKKNLLCIDLGTTTGWASLHYVQEKPIIESGSISLKTYKDTRYGIRYHNFFQWLEERLIKMRFVDAIVYEQVINHPARNKTITAHVYGGLAATLTLWCEINNIPYTSLNVNTIKKLATGYGNSKKEHVIQSIQLRGHSPKDDNEADALAILYAAQQNSEVLCQVTPDENIHNKKRKPIKHPHILIPPNVKSWRKVKVKNIKHQTIVK